ncbi:MAG: DUF5723 family protein [Bacteroidota bacterium]|nr:DUF5723 family protein [Bacteroidota bacterium]
MKLKNILPLVFCSLALQIKSQDLSEFKFVLPQSKNSIGAKTELFAGSDALSNSLFTTLLKGQFLDTKLKNESLILMDDKNNAGLQWHSTIEFTKSQVNFLGLKNADWSLSLSNHNSIEARFNKDLYELFFFGNAPFENRLAKFQDLEFINLNYQMIETGFKQWTSRFGFGLKVAYVNGHAYLDLETTRGSLFTATNGTYLDLDLKLESKMSNPDKIDFGSMNGQGAALSIFGGFKFNENASVSLDLDRIGFISWNAESQKRSIDTMVHFEGIVVNNLLDSIYVDIKSTEEIKNEFIKIQPSQKFKTSLPFHVTLKYDQFIFNHKIHWSTQLAYYNSKINTPYVETKLNYFLFPGFCFGPVLGFGGYSKWNAGIQTSVLILKTLYIHANAASLVNLLNQEKPAVLIGSVQVKLLF